MTSLVDTSGVVTATAVAPLRRSAPRFVLTGIASAAADFGVLALLHGVLSVPLALATAFAFGFAFVVNFTLSRQWAFASGRSGSARRHLGRYTILVAINLGVTVGLVTGLASLGVHYLIAKLAATLLIATANFLAYRHWVFV